MGTTTLTSKVSQLRYLILSLSVLLCANNLFGQKFGITSQEVSIIEDTGHQLQLWQVTPEFTKNANYEISIKHAVVGTKGSFYITAWADTNNDGKPDKELGRSELLMAKSEGDWSSWKFYSNYSKIFVGNTWSQTDEKVYYQIGGSVNGYEGLGNAVFFSRAFNGTPAQSTSPRYTNIKVRIIDSGEQQVGITDQEVTRIEDTGHYIQLWQVLPEFTRNANYEVKIKHAVTGSKGSFYITAWADTNNDGIPDKEIGRSDLLTASREGDWSSWRFSSSYSRLFVGNTWSQSDEKVYYQTGGTVLGYKGLDNKVFYSRSFNGIPSQSTGPRYTNIKLIIR